MKIEQIDLKGAKIVRFAPEYAASIADMWNSSTEGWNGEYWDMTEDKVIREETGAESIALYLLINQNNDVQGYCKLEEYDDKKGIYISLLNVRPSQWGKGYGKALLLQSLQTAVEMGYERIDLHSWEGNMRAVPLYKRIGFRWQANASGMYMMNFLPLLMNMDSLKEVFENLDWYKNIDCDYSLQPDSVMKNGFEFLSYSWQRNDEHLQAVFDAKAKGLCSLKCCEFEIELLMENKKVFYGDNTLKLRVKNHRQDSLQLNYHVQGKADIKADVTASANVDDEELLLIPFTVIDGYQKKGNDDSEIIASVLLDGKKVELKMQLEPQAPVSANLQPELQRIYRCGDSEVYLQLKNNLPDKVKIDFDVPDIKHLRFIDHKVNLELLPREIKTLKLKTKLAKGCFYNQKVQLKLASVNQKYQYSQRLQLVLPDLNSIIFAETDSNWILQNGQMKLTYEKWPTDCPFNVRMLNTNFWMFMRLPKLSAPYDLELLNALPEKVTSIDLEDGVEMKVRYKCKNINLMVSHVFKMYHNGNWEHHFDLENTGIERLEIDTVETGFNLEVSNAVYEGKVLHIDEDERRDSWLSLDADKITPGWLYYREKGANIALTWDKNSNLAFSDWWQRAIYKAGTLQPSESKRVYGETVMVNSFTSWQEYYYWYFGNDCLYPRTIGIQRAVVNDNNPFADDMVSVKMCDLADKTIERTIIAVSGGNRISLEKDKGVAVPAMIKNGGKVSLKVDEESQRDVYSRLLFPKQANDPVFYKTKEKGVPVYTLSSENIEIKSSPEFKAGIFSLKYKGKELLTTSFPEPRVRLWENKWTGGVYIKPIHVPSAQAKSQKFSLEKICRKDNFGNIWQGFSHVITFNDKITRLENVLVRNNYLVSPSHNIIAMFSEVLDTQGRFVTEYHTRMVCCLSENLVKEIHSDNKQIKISSRVIENSKLDFCSVFAHSNDLYQYFVSHKKELDVYVGDNMGMIGYNSRFFAVKPDMITIGEPVFWVISEKQYTKLELQVLKDIRWS